jgi:integrase
MGVVVRGNSYQVKFMVKGDKYGAYFASRGAAEDWEKESRARLKRGLPVIQPSEIQVSTEKTLGEAITNCQTKYWSGLRRPDIQVYNANVFREWAGTNTPMSEAFSQDTLLEFLNYLRDDREVGVKTQNHYVSTLKTLMTHAQVVCPLLFKQVPEPEGKVRFFTEKEYAEIVAWFDTQKGKSRYKDFFIFLVHMGARPWSEGTGLTWDNVGKDRITLIGTTTKTMKRRTLPMPKEAIAAIDRQRDNGLAGPWAGLHVNAGALMWRELRKAIPSLNDTVWYTARHTCASWQVQRGNRLYHVSKWLGHTSLETTEKFYADLATDHLVENLAAFDDYDMSEARGVSKYKAPEQGAALYMPEPV